MCFESRNHRGSSKKTIMFDHTTAKGLEIIDKVITWFSNSSKPDIVPDGTDMIQLKEWLIALMIQAQAKAGNQKQLSNANDSWLWLCDTIFVCFPCTGNHETN